MDGDGAPVVRTRGLSKHFGSSFALREVDLRVEEGEFVTLFGPNGAGKTTLVRILATLARPSDGTVELFGDRLGDVGAGVRSRLGVVSHKSFLSPALSAWQNLKFYARLFAIDDADDRIATLLREVGLVRRMHDPVAGFSRGMEQRCAIARALLHDPALLLFDEPFAGLDPEAADRLHELLEGVRDRRRSVLLTSHDLGRGAGLADRVVFLAAGRVVYDRQRGDLDPEELRRLYRPPGGSASR